MKLNMSIILVILLFLFTLLFQSCEPHFIINKNDPAYVGDYKLIIDREHIPDTMFQLVPYIIPFTQGLDKFPIITLSVNILPFVDTTIFFEEERDSIIIYCKTSPGQFSSSFSINGITENLRVFSHVDTVSILNPFSLTHTEPVYLQSCSLSLDWDKTLNFDNTYLATWYYQGRVCTLSIFTPLIVTIDSLEMIVSVSVCDSSGNTCDLMQKNINATVHKPVLSCPPEVKAPIGEVMIPLRFVSEIPVTDLFYRIDNSDPPINKKITNQTNDTIKVSINESATKVFQIWVMNAVSASNICTTKVVTYSPDTANPTIRLVDTTISNQILQQNSYECEVIVKDDIGIKETYFLADSIKIPAVPKSDSLWSGNITDIPLKQIFPVKGMVVDSSGKLDSVEFTLYWDATSNDKQPPYMKQLTGPLDGDRVTTDTGSISIEIVDSSGIDSAYFMLNGAFVNNLTLSSTNLYTFSFKLSNFGTNKIDISAIDGSINKNVSTKMINLNYNTIPTMISGISPVNGSVGIDHTNGVVISWSGGDDPDGDIITYLLQYGTDPSTMQTISSAQKKITLNNLNQNTTYFWYLYITTQLDTLRCPTGLTEYYQFTTKDENAPTIVQIDGPIDGERIKNSTVTMKFLVTDTNGIDSTWFDLNGSYMGIGQNTSENEYTISFTMSQYGQNLVTFHATDGSTVNNHSSKTICIIYYSLPTQIIPISPPINNDNVENLIPVTFSWHPSQDADGDLINYVLQYGSNTNNLFTKSTLDTSLNIAGLEGNTEYYWFVNVIAGYDTVRCPETIGSYYNFHTIDHSATISNFNNFSCSVNDTITISVTATDPEGIKEYQWDFNGDNIIEITTLIGTVNYISPSIISNDNFILKVIDNKNGITRDTSSVIITNDIPVIDELPDTLFFKYKEEIIIQSNAKDDGSRLIYEWNFGDGFKQVNNGDTAFSSPLTNLPVIETYILKVSDEDNNSIFDSIIVVTDMAFEKHNSKNNFSRIVGITRWNEQWVAFGNDSLNGNGIHKSNDLINWDIVDSSKNGVDFYTAFGTGNNYLCMKVHFPSRLIYTLNLESFLWADSEFDKKLSNPFSSEIYKVGDFSIIIGETSLEIFDISINFIQSYPSPIGEGNTIHTFNLPSYSMPNEVWIIGGKNKNNLYKITSDMNNPIQYNKELDITSVNTGDLYYDGKSTFWILKDNEILKSTDFGDNFLKVRNSTPWKNATYINLVRNADSYYIISDDGIFSVYLPD